MAETKNALRRVLHIIREEMATAQQEEEAEPMARSAADAAQQVGGHQGLYLGLVHSPC